jgi:flagellar basal-body rod protein FlgF/flagellar basal-body rod protein FlgG
MLRGLYSATTALEAAMEKQEATAQNLANSSVPGYRARNLAFETFDLALNRAVEPTGDIVGTHSSREYFNFTPGAFQVTGNPLDLALQSDGFFVLEGPNGPLYTRNGQFRMNPQGQILSRGGNYPLLGTLGGIQVPPGTINLAISADGVVTADGVNVGQVRRVRFIDLTKLTPAGPTLFKAPNPQGNDPGPGLQESTEGLLQGTLESSNVNPAQAMVEMILGTRYFEAAQRALRGISESLQLNTRPQT